MFVAFARLNRGTDFDDFLYKDGIKTLEMVISYLFCIKRQGEEFMKLFKLIIEMFYYKYLSVTALIMG